MYDHDNKIIGQKILNYNKDSLILTYFFEFRILYEIQPRPNIYIFRGFENNL